MLSFIATASTVSASEGGGVNPLAWNTDLALWTAVIFVILLFVLGRFAFGPIVKALDAREQAMTDKVAAVEKANADARELLNQYQQRLADSEQEVRQMLDSAKADAQKASNDIIAAAKVKAEEEHKRALAEIDAATEGALADLAARSATLATSLAGKILKEEITPERHKQLISGALGEFSKN
ncbi:MAG: F0F1 ATP synthase subunit B [Planctomycetia bacterium]|nr:F0F1 ATP synthase subunit B [Planctomycetia bacterium]